MNSDRTKSTLARATRIGAALSLLLWIAGCGHMREERKDNALDAATNGYSAAIRWGYYETAVGYLSPKKRKINEVPKFLSNIRVTSYDVVQPLVPMGDDERVQVVHIEYVHDDVQSVHSLTDRQTWRYDLDTKAWWLDSGLPAFK